MSSPARFDEGIIARIVERAPDAVIVVDAGGQVAYWNGGAERMFGYPPSEALGQSLDLIIPERLRDRHWNAFHHAVATGTSRYGEADLLAVPALTRDGRTISVEFTIVLVRTGNAVTYVAAFMRDVTERRARESELRRRVAELEGPPGPGSPP